MQRVRLTFVLLVVIAAVSTGSRWRAMTWRAGPVAGLTVAASGLLAVAAIVLAARIVVVLDRRTISAESAERSADGAP